MSSCRVKSHSEDSLPTIVSFGEDETEQAAAAWDRVNVIPLSGKWRVSSLAILWALHFRRTKLLKGLNWSPTNSETHPEKNQTFQRNRSLDAFHCLSTIFWGAVGCHEWTDCHDGADSYAVPSQKGWGNCWLWKKRKLFNSTKRNRVLSRRLVPPFLLVCHELRN